MDEKKRNQVVESLKKVDPKLIADVLREILHSDDEPVVRRRPINPSQNQTK
jgi:hypothetical protein